MQSFNMFRESLNANLIATIDEFEFGSENKDPEKIIRILEEGADPCSKGKFNTVLTAAINYGMDELIDFILNKYAEGHRVFSEHDTFHGNTPLSLALKKGQYDLAEKLINKACDVNCKIGHEPFHTYPLHLCAFLLGTSGDEDKEAQLAKMIKLLVTKGSNTNDVLHWGQKPSDVLMMNIQKEDFMLYKDNRNYFTYYLGNPYSEKEVSMVKAMLEVRNEITDVKEAIRQLEAGEDTTGYDEMLKELEEELKEYESEHPQISKDLQTLIEFEKKISDFKIEHADWSRNELTILAKECAEKNPESAKMAEYYNRKTTYSLNEVREMFDGQIPESFQLREGHSLTNAWFPYLPYMFLEHCIWHRPGMDKDTITKTRNFYFATEAGKEVRIELLKVMEPVSHIHQI